MIELKIPYIGVKIESIPTILKVLKDSKNELDFITFYTELGKSKKTATEYLASLRNLKLASKDKNGNTIISPSGENLLKDNIDKFYVNLLKHCTKLFPDLKVIKDLLLKNENLNLNDLLFELTSKGYNIKRKQTLSSFFKLINEGSKAAASKNNNIGANYSREPLEYHQFIKIIKKYSTEKVKNKTILIDFYKWITEKYFLTKEDFTKFLSVSKSTGEVKLLEINPKVIKDQNSIFFISGRPMYFFEIL